VVFSGKAYYKAIFKVQKSKKPYDFLSIPTIQHYHTVW